MWRVIIQCSAETWRNHAAAFKAIAEQYPVTTLSSKKMKEDERRIMEYQVDDIEEAENFIQACTSLEGFTGSFESL